MRNAEERTLGQAIDITPLHIEDAKGRVVAHGLFDCFLASYGDSDDLIDFKNSSFDGISTMETFFDADCPLRVASNFLTSSTPERHTSE